MKRENGSKPAMTTTTAKSSKKGTVPATMDIQREVKPTTEDIRRRAYEIYMQRMHRGEPGSPESDWDRAERELKRR